MCTFYCSFSCPKFNLIANSDSATLMVTLNFTSESLNKFSTSNLTENGLEIASKGQIIISKELQEQIQMNDKEPNEIFTITKVTRKISIFYMYRPIDLSLGSLGLAEAPGASCWAPAINPVSNAILHFQFVEKFNGSVSKAGKIGAIFGAVVVLALVILGLCLCSNFFKRTNPEEKHKSKDTGFKQDEQERMMSESS
jgi:hypothetical protein